MTSHPESQSLYYFQQKCFDYNIHTKLIEDITTIDFENDEAEHGAGLLIKALNLIYDLGPSVTYGDIKNFGRTAVTKNWTVIDLSDIFKKVFDETCENNRSLGLRQLEHEHIITLTLLYLNNFESYGFQKSLDDLMFSLAVDDESNSQIIIWSLLAILDKTASGGIGEEILPTWLPISFVSTSKIATCRKIIRSLTPISERFPDALFKKSEFEQFWEAVKDDNKFVELEHSQNLEESLFAKLFQLVYAPIFIEEREMIQNITTILCGMFENWNIYYLDNRFSRQFLQNFLDLLNVVTSEKSICDVLKSIDKILQALSHNSYDYRSVIDKLAASAGKNRNIVAYCRRENFTNISEVLFEFPYSDSLKTTEEFKKEFSQPIGSSEQEEDTDTVSTLSNYLNILNTSGQFLPSLSNVTEQLMKRFQSRNLKTFESFLELHKDTLNCLVRKNFMVWLYQMLLSYPKLLPLDIRIVCHETNDQNATLELLSECLKEYKESTCLDDSITLTEPIMRLSLSLRVDEIKEKFHDLAVSYQAKINRILRNTTSWPRAGAFCSLFSKYRNFLEKDVKRSYVELGLIQLPTTEIESILEDVLDSVSSRASEKTIFHTFSTIDTFLRLLGGSTSKTNKVKFVKFAEIHKLVLNFFLQNGSPHHHILRLLIHEPSILDFKNKLDYIAESSDVYSKEFFDNFASECLGESNDEKQVEKIGQAIVSLIYNVAMSACEFEDFIEKHKLLISSCLRKSDQLELFVILLPYRSKIDSDIIKEYLENNRLSPSGKSFLLNGILSQLSNSVTRKVALEFLPTVEKLFGSFRLDDLIDSQYQFKDFAMNNKKLLNEILLEHKKIFESGAILRVLASVVEILAFDVKMIYDDQLIPFLEPRQLWKLLEECMKRHSQQLSSEMLVPINNILNHVMKNRSSISESYHKMFVEKYKSTFNNILAQEQSYPFIVEFFAYFPHFLTFNNKIKYLPEVLKQNDIISLVIFLHECLIKLKNQTPDDSEICAAVQLAVTHVPIDKTDTLYKLTDMYATELKKVVELVGFDKGIAWTVILTKLGISYLDFETKVKNLREQLVWEKQPGVVQLEINRSTVFLDSFYHLNSRSLSEWKSQFRIKFTNENGIDAGGLLREWFTILTREIFNPNYALFTTASDDNNSYTINKASHVNPEHLDYFKFVGRFMGKSIMEQQYVNCPFTKSLCKHILNIPVDFTDFQNEDPIFCNSLKTLLNTPISEVGLELTFSTDVEEIGVVSEKELKKNGKNIGVTDDNKEEYVQLLYQMKMTGSIRKQLDYFLSGFYDMIPKHLIALFTVKELELLICGEPEIDIDDLEANTKYEGFQKSDTTTSWFWRAVRSFDKNDKAKLLMFATGSSKSPPGGFASKLEKFVVSKSWYDDNRLPTAHTCAYKLVLPQYGSYEKLRQSLLTAIRECSEGFGFS